MSVPRHSVKADTEAGENCRRHADHEQNAVHVGLRTIAFGLVGKLAVWTGRCTGHAGGGKTDHHGRQNETLPQNISHHKSSPENDWPGTYLNVSTNSS